MPASASLTCPRVERHFKCSSLPRAMNSWSAYWYPPHLWRYLLSCRLPWAKCVNVVTLTLTEYTHTQMHVMGLLRRYRQENRELQHTPLTCSELYLRLNISVPDWLVWLTDYQTEKKTKNTKNKSFVNSYFQHGTNLLKPTQLPD